MLNCAYADNNIRNDVARALGMEPETVTKLRAIVTHVSEESNEVFMQRTAHLFKARPPDTFAAGFSCDAAQETLTLPMDGFDGEGTVATRSAWHVMVSSHRFSCPLGGYCESSCVRPWERVEMARPNVALTSSESALTLWHAGFHVRSVQGFAMFEIAGVKSAVRALINYDVDGHPI